jgi:arylsulfatase A-like enzyme
MLRTDNRPNLVFVFTDQQSALAVGGPGRPWLRTPALNGLAARGVSFDRSYCASPVCGPSRACLVTGQAPHETGVLWNGQPLRPGLATMGERVRAAGYRTAWAGKWHLPKSYPQGQQDVAGFENLTLDPAHPRLQNDPGYGWPGYALGTNTDGPFVDRAIEFLGQPHDRPFLLAVSLHNPHDICWWVRRPRRLPGPSELPPLPANFARPDPGTGVPAARARPAPLWRGTAVREGLDGDRLAGLPARLLPHDGGGGRGGRAPARRAATERPGRQHRRGVHQRPRRGHGGASVAGQTRVLRGSGARAPDRRRAPAWRVADGSTPRTS